MKTKATVTCFRALGTLLSGLTLTIGNPHVLLADQGPAGTCCQEIGPAQRDARGLIDSCLTTTQASCNNPQWCAILAIPDGWYCATGPSPCPPESTCYGVPITGGVQDGYCQWGYGNAENPRPSGECFCLYDEQKDPVYITVYDCSS